MRLELVPVKILDVPRFLAMQREAFLPLLLRYRDGMQNPANETVEQVLQGLFNTAMETLLIRMDGQFVGGMKTVRKQNGRYRLSRLFILPTFQNLGIASDAILAMEARNPQATSWELDTIAQEAGNCHLYRKMGYRWTGRVTLCGPKKALVDFVKHMERG